MTPEKVMIDAIVKVVAQLAAANRFADGLGQRRSGEGDQEAARLGNDLNRLGKEAIQLGVDLAGQFRNAGAVSYNARESRRRCQAV